MWQHCTCFCKQPRQAASPHETQESLGQAVSAGDSSQCICPVAVNPLLGVGEGVAGCPALSACSSHLSARWAAGARGPSLARAGGSQPPSCPETQASWLRVPLPCVQLSPVGMGLRDLGPKPGRWCKWWAVPHVWPESLCRLLVHWTRRLSWAVCELVSSWMDTQMVRAADRTYQILEHQALNLQNTLMFPTPATTRSPLFV